MKRIILLLVILSAIGCATSRPLPECPPCPPGPVIKVPVPVPCAPIEVQPTTPSPSCEGAPSQIVKCVLDYIQALLHEIEDLREAIFLHNLRTE